MTHSKHNPVSLLGRMSRAVRAAVSRGILLLSLLLVGCIEPPLHLPADDVLVDMPIVVTDLEIVWNVDVDWQTDWHYGWDEMDEELFGPIAYPDPTNYEVRRYFLGEAPGMPHTRSGMDGFTIFGKHCRRTYMFGYYDLLFWSNIDSPTMSQVLQIDESDINEVTATTTVTRGLLRDSDPLAVTGLFNQPEIFYSAYERDIYLSRNKEDYDYFDEEENVWVKQINTELTPLVYIYLVQVILHNNDGRITGITGDAAISAFASGTSVNTGHTNNHPCMVYFPTRLKKNCTIEGEQVDIIGGKLTTFGLCDMEGWRPNSRAEYIGSRTDLDNYAYFTLKFNNGKEKTIRALITDQCRAQSHGGILTIHINCLDISVPGDDSETKGDLFVPTIDDYENVDYDMPM